MVSARLGKETVANNTDEVSNQLKPKRPRFMVSQLTALVTAGFTLKRFELYSALKNNFGSAKVIRTLLLKRPITGGGRCLYDSIMLNQQPWATVYGSQLKTNTLFVLETLTRPRTGRFGCPGTLC